MTVPSPSEVEALPGVEAVLDRIASMEAQVAALSDPTALLRARARLAFWAKVVLRAARRRGYYDLSRSRGWPAENNAYYYGDGTQASERALLRPLWERRNAITEHVTFLNAHPDTAGLLAYTL